MRFGEFALTAVVLEPSRRIIGNAVLNLAPDFRLSGVKSSPAEKFGVGYRALSIIGRYPVKSKVEGDRCSAKKSYCRAS